MAFAVTKQQVTISQQFCTFSQITSDIVVQHYTSSGIRKSCIPISSSKSHTNLPLRVETVAATERHVQQSLSRGGRYGTKHCLSPAAATEGGQQTIPEADLAGKGALATFDSVPGEDVDFNDIGSVKAALMAAHARTSSAERERAEALTALAHAEARQHEFSASLVEAKESAMREIQAAKASFNMELQSIIDQKLAVESELVLSRQNAIELAMNVEKVADSVVDEAKSHLAQEARLKIAAAEASAAEAAATVADKIKTVSIDTANAMIRETRDAIEKSFAALEAAKDKARKSEIALFQRVQILDDMVLKEASALGLQQTVSSLQRQLEAGKNEINRLQAEVKAVLARAEAAEARAAAGDEALIRVQEAANTSAVEHEESARKALEALKIAGAERLDAARSAFKADVEVLQAAVDTVQKAQKSEEQSYLRRYQALERALGVTENLVKAWKERALEVEELLQKSREEDVNAIEVGGGIHSVLTGGRMETLLGNDSRKWDLLANGPRRETPDWMIRRIEVALQGIPPRNFVEDQEESDVHLHLPTPAEVWSIAGAKVKEDLYTKEAAEKEAIDEQRRVLEKTLKKKAVRRPETPSESGTGSGREIVFQGFNWESWRRKWYLELEPKASDLSSCGITTIWFPPPTQSVSPQGYMPGDLYNLDSSYGSTEELKHCIDEMHNHDLLVLGDAVLNHRCAQHKGPNGVWNVFGGKLAWGPEAIVRDDPNFHGRGNPSNGGDFFHAAPNIDHSQDFVRRDIKEWMKWLRTEIGYDGWRLDFVRGFWGGYVKEYIEETEPAFAIGEYWDSLAYEGGTVCYNQDAHRQRIVNWVNATGGASSAFDVTTKGILHAALHNEYWRLIDPQGKPPGVLGWWPSRAVTFLENHDTGSTQGHWPFPREKIMQGYTYILTHPGTPVIFYDHFYDFGLHDPIAELIAIRTRTGVHCRSPVKIYHATKEGYAAQVGENLVMKLGRLDWNPSKENNLVGHWQRCIDKGADYQIWERK